MRRWLTVVITLALALSVGVRARADYDAVTDYMNIMIDCAVRGDYEGGIAAEEARNEKIESLELDYVPVAYDDLNLLSKIIYAEAGSNWLSDEWKMCVGEVVLNRVESPEFPDTIREVIEQPGQYYGKISSYFENLKPSRHCVELALRLLEGERLMEPAVVFQSILLPSTVGIV